MSQKDTTTTTTTTTATTATQALSVWEEAVENLYEKGVAIGKQNDEDVRGKKKTMMMMMMFV
jgi:hypothetical protein